MPNDSSDNSHKSFQMPDSRPAWWIKILPESFKPYAALSRLDRPTGIWLLLVPCLIGLSFSSAQLDSAEQYTAGFWLGWVILFFLGSVFMRGAGCTWNDIQDRKLDERVERTRMRPLPSEQVTLKQAWVFLGIQLFGGFLVWLFLPFNAKIVALGTIPLVAAYPFMKRITWWPQAWLGLTFNSGVLIAVAAVAELKLGVLVLYGGLVLWTIAYDTIYAMQDAEDDRIAGIKSTALLLGSKGNLAVLLFHTCASVLVMIACVYVDLQVTGVFISLLFLGYGVRQYFVLKNGETDVALGQFKLNVLAGNIIVIGFCISAILRSF